MALVPDIPGARQIARALKGLNPNDIDSDEMDNVIMRIFVELRRQLSMLEDTKSDQLESPDRERNARILSHFERTMERLVKLEAERGAARKSKVKNADGNVRKAVRDKIDRIIRFELKGQASCGSDG
jgi:hypothetical protein